VSKPAITNHLTGARETYRMRRCAELGGVTVKALRHYERLGLLVPARTAAGHRVYAASDLDRLRRIRALKDIGVALATMRPLLDAGPTALRAHLAARRDALAHERDRVQRAERAIALVEESLRYAPADDRGLSRLADVIDMRREAARMQGYFSEDVREAALAFYQAWPGEEWIALYREIVAAIPEGPGTERAAGLLHRWNTLALSLWRDLAADPGRSRLLHEGFARAWRDRHNWPPLIARRFADYRMDDVSGFLGRASIAAFSRTGHAPGEQPRAAAAPGGGADAR